MISNDELAEKLDKTLGRLNAIEEEFTLQMDKYEQINELENRIDDFDRRLKKLEHPNL